MFMMLKMKSRDVGRVANRVSNFMERIQGRTKKKVIKDSAGMCMCD